MHTKAFSVVEFSFGPRWGAYSAFPDPVGGLGVGKKDGREKGSGAREVTREGRVGKGGHDFAPVGPFLVEIH